MNAVEAHGRGKPGDVCLKVFFDGACPLCQREVAFYRTVATPSVEWLDVSDSSLVLPQSTLASQGAAPPRAELLARFHVLTAEGIWLHGARAFVALWEQLGPAWRALAFVCRLPGGIRILEASYQAFLRKRPQLQAIAHALTQPHHLPEVIVPEIRSDQAGETGAVFIYRAMLRFGRDARLHPMLREHLEQESRHLDALNALLPWKHRSRLLPLWKVAGYLTGAIPAILGTRWMLATIAAVERFVDRHYQHQIDLLGGMPEGEDVRALLVTLRADELRHRDDALAALGSLQGAGHPGVEGSITAVQCAGQAAIVEGQGAIVEGRPAILTGQRTGWTSSGKMRSLQATLSRGMLGIWQVVVESGSSLAVKAARRI